MNRVTIKVGEKEMTIDEARSTYMELHKIFCLQQRSVEQPLNTPERPRTVVHGQPDQICSG